MTQLYDFYDRKNELKELLSNFEELTNEKQSKCFIVQGKKDIGKTRLVNEFVNQIEKDVRLISNIPEFKKENNLIKFTCEENSSSPYYPFINITKDIKKRTKLIDLSIKFIQIILAIFGINDTLKALNDFANTVNENKDSEKLRKKEIKVFNQYKKFIRNRSSKTPFIIFLQNVQWIDIYSLKLIHTLISGKDSFWGMIVLEYDDLEINEEIIDELNHISQNQNVSQLNLFSLDKSFPSKMLSSKFGTDFFNSEENDILFTVSEGNPGTLVRFIENYCINTHLINKKGNKWVKKDEFQESIKPVNQKLLELIVSLYEDKELSEGELRLIRKMSKLWGIKDSSVSFTVNMVKDIMDAKYKIGQILGSGIFGKNSFLVYRNNSKYIIEYIKLKKSIAEESQAKREIENNYLLEAIETKISSNGILLIWDFYDGKRSRDFLLKAFAKHLSDNLTKFIQLSEGLSELHKNEMVHGFIKPETIIETKEGKFKLASFDPWFIDYIADDFNNKDNWENNLYLSPEQLNGEKPTASSDIYSLGILFYKSLTNKFPYHGRTISDLLDSIENDKLELNGQFSQIFPSKIIIFLRKTTAFNPENRFSDAEEFKKELLALQKEISEGNFTPGLTPELGSNLPPVQKSKKIIKPVWISVLIVAIFTLIYFNWVDIKNVFNSQIIEIENEITISLNSINKTKDLQKIIDYNSIEFLIHDGVQRSNGKSLLKELQFSSIYPSTSDIKKVPSKEIKGTIINGDFNYELILEIKDNTTGKTRKERIPFNDPTQFINTGMLELISLILNNPIAISPITDDWDAYKSFYNGEKHWAVLNKTQAKIDFIKSLSIDPDFILPKLRLAKIYHFEGNNQKALEQLREVKNKIGELSKVDSIRTIALENVLLGNQREAINNYRALLSYLPATKEPYFELAEAYFNIREINQAMSNYNSALMIDSDFSLAINHYAYCFSHIGEHNKALELFKKYVNLDSSANSFDSYGDGFFSAGEYDSARIYKQMGLNIDPELDYLYNSLSYINIASGKIMDAERNINDYLELQTDPEMVSNGLTIKAFIYYSTGNYQKALDTCALAKSIYDSNDLITRNHEMHWLLAKTYYKLGQDANALAEMREMEQIIEEYEINENNYNEILKFYSDLKFIEFCQNNSQQRITEITELFDFSIGNKIKDWSSPFDPAFFNTEFGMELLENGYTDLAIIRFKKAL